MPFSSHSALLRSPRSLFLSLLFSLSLTPVGAAAGALDDVVEEFLGGAVHTGLPAGFPVVAVPAGLQLRVVGTLAAGNIKQVLLEAPDTIAASAALRTAFVAAGWTDLTTTPVVVLLCHDTHGSLQITPGTRGPGRLRVLHSPDNIFAVDPVTPAGCARPPSTGGQSWYAWIVDLLPVLSVPPQAQPMNPGQFTPQPLPRPGIVTARTNGTGLLELTVSVAQENVIAVPAIDIAGLDAHFAARLREQGWQRDSGGSGQRSATSVWYRTASVTPGTATEAQDVVLAGTLTLQHLRDDEFYIRLDLQGSVETPFGSGTSSPIGDSISSCTPLNDPQIGIRGVPAGATSITATGSRICRL